MQRNHEDRRVGGVVTQRIANPLPISGQDIENKAQHDKTLWEKSPGQTPNKARKPKTQDGDQSPELGRDLPAYVERRHGRNGQSYFYFRRGKGKTVRLYREPGTPEFFDEVAKLTRGIPSAPQPRPRINRDMRKEDSAENMRRHMVAIFRAARSRAKAARRDFAITREWLFQLLEAQNYKCAATGAVMSKTIAKHDPWAPSIDRIDVSKGYIKTNCRLVAYIYNCARNQFSDDDLHTMAEAIVAKRKRRDACIAQAKALSTPARAKVDEVQP